MDSRGGLALGMELSAMLVAHQHGRSGDDCILEMPSVLAGGFAYTWATISMLVPSLRGKVGGWTFGKQLLLMPLVEG